MTEYNMSGHPFRSAYSRAGVKCKRATPATLDEAGETALANAKTAIAKYDPSGTALKFAFISDLHRSEEGVYVSNAIDDRYSLRLLSRLCDDLDIDAVFCGGDITNGRSENQNYTQKNMGDVVSDLDDLLPYTTVFGSVGNHDKEYGDGASQNPYYGPFTSNAQLKTLWSVVHADGSGVEMHYLDDTNFYVDFPAHKVRMIVVNQYDGVDSNSSWWANEFSTDANGQTTHCTAAWHAAFPTTDKADWLVGVVYHGADTGAAGDVNIDHFKLDDLQNTMQAYIANGGKGIIGAFAGHYHNQTMRTIFPSLNVVHVGCAYATSTQVGSANAYCFSVFVLDSDTGDFHEIRVGRGAKTTAFGSFLSAGQNKGLLQNGTILYNTNTDAYLCVRNGNEVRIEGTDWQENNGTNLTNLAKNGRQRADYVTGDDSDPLFSAETGDVVKTEIKFSSDTDLLDDGSTTNGAKFAVFSNAIPASITSGVFVSGMVYGRTAAGQTLTNEVTMAADADFRAIGIRVRKQAASGILGFELNVYLKKAGTDTWVKQVRATT